MTNGEDPATIAGLIGRVHERDGVAFDANQRSTPYSAREFATSCWKAGNLYSHYGVRTGSRVAVVVGPKSPTSRDEPGVLADAPDPLLATFGATVLGATVTFDPDATVEGDALVAPAAWLDRYDVGPGCVRIAYGGPPAAADVVHFEQATWSQNPVEPPEAARVTPDDAALFAGEPADGDGGPPGSHAGLLERARATVAEHALAAGDRVAIDGPLDAETFADGVLAPLLSGGTIVGGGDASGDFVVR